MQTLSRLNRTHEAKTDTFILDFVNDAGTVSGAFGKYYRSSVMPGETDPARLDELLEAVCSAGVFTYDDVRNVTAMYLNGFERADFEPVLSRCAERFCAMREGSRREFLRNARGFMRTYNFLSAVLPFGSVRLEEHAIFLKLLTARLRIPDTECDTGELLEYVDLESFRAEAGQMMELQASGDDGELLTLASGRGQMSTDGEIENLTDIITEFNRRYGGILARDKVRELVRVLPDSVMNDERFRSAAQYSDIQNAREESDRASDGAVMSVLGGEILRITEEKAYFRKMLRDYIFRTAYSVNQRKQKIF